MSWEQVALEATLAAQKVLQIGYYDSEKITYQYMAAVTVVKVGISHGD